MAETGTTRLVDILEKHERDLLAAWIEQQLNAVTVRQDLISERDLLQ